MLTVSSTTEGNGWCYLLSYSMAVFHIGWWIVKLTWIYYLMANQLLMNRKRLSQPAERGSDTFIILRLNWHVDIGMWWNSPHLAYYHQARRSRATAYSTISAVDNKVCDDSVLLSLLSSHRVVTYLSRSGTCRQHCPTVSSPISARSTHCDRVSTSCDSLLNAWTNVIPSRTSSLV